MGLAAVKPWEPSAQDRQRENALQTLFLRFAAASEPTDRRQLWREIQTLHNQRGPQYVAWMEAQKGLLRG